MMQDHEKRETQHDKLGKIRNHVQKVKDTDEQAPARKDSGCAPTPFFAARSFAAPSTQPAEQQHGHLRTHCCSATRSKAADGALRQRKAGKGAKGAS